MTEIYGAPTLHDALTLLSERIRSSEREGFENLIFCEDRLTLLAERAVVAATGGTMKTEVTTFARFLRGGEVLSKQGSVMALSALLSAHEGELNCFRKGAAQAVYETIAQLSASRVDEEMLLSASASCDGMLSLKLKDLALLLKAYKEFLAGRGLLDENGYLALLPGEIARTADKRLFFFGFPAFTRQALGGVRAALEKGNVTGIFIAGKGGCFRNEAARLFRRTAEEFGETKSHQMIGTLAGEALTLSKTILSPDVYAHAPVQAEHVHIFRPADEHEEIDTVCALIRRHVERDGYRYRDFALLLPNKERFLEAECVLSSYRIPFYSDRKRPLSEHPFVTFALAALSCVYDGCRPDSVDAFLASVYFGGGDSYRNYLLKYGGYRGGVKRAIKDVAGYDKGALAAAQERALSMLALFPREGRTELFCRGMEALFALSDGEAVTAALQKNVSPEMQSFLQTEKLFSAVAEIRETVGYERCTALEFSELLKSGLSALEISMIPRRSDVVFVGDLTESKLDRVKVLFCAGLDESVPRTGEDTAVITDRELGRLKELAVEIEPAIAVVNARAREAVSLNLCNFEKELYLSCPKTAGGEETRTGEVISGAEHIFRSAPMPDLFPYFCSEALPAARRIAALYEEGCGEDFSALYEALSELGEKEQLVRIARGGRKVAVRRAQELYFSEEISPTMLEEYFACPYAGFAKGLKLREREERPVLDTDAGTFVHAVLEKTAARFEGFKREEEAREAAEQCAREMLALPRYAPLSDTDAGIYTGERLVKECGAVTQAAFRQLLYSEFHVKETELKVSLPELGIAGRLDRADESDGYVRVIDYKTGSFDDTPAAYYMGRKLQLQLYLLAAAKGKKPAGAFYFPAAESFQAEGDAKYRMSGFFSSDEEVLSRMDTVRTEGKSEFFEGGGASGNGLPQTDFEDFLGYAALVSARAKAEMEKGNIQPSPDGKACAYCKYKGMCAFAGRPRESESVTCRRIAGIVRDERGDGE